MNQQPNQHTSPEERWFRAPVRPLVTLMITATFCYLSIIGRIPVEAFLTIVGVVVTFWFTSRQRE